MIKFLNIFFLFFCLVMISTPLSVRAFSSSDIETFNIHPLFHPNQRHNISAIRQRVTNKIYFYIEESWWNSITDEEKKALDERIYNIGARFSRDIYPRITSIFGDKPNHTVDDSDRITILFHKMPREVGGYFNSADQHSVFRIPRSNERNIIYLNSRHIHNNLLENFLVHEFIHLITFNQKEVAHRVSEDIWLNDARAEFAPTFLGFTESSGCNLRNRIFNFIKFATTSLTEWIHKEEDYGVVSVFAHYLVDHYGIEILADSIKSEKIGIKSINEALVKNGFSEDFSQIFTDWTIASLVNDCSLGERYCFLNPKLQNLRISPQTTLLPELHGSSFSSREGTKSWAGNWHRIVGGLGDLVLDFDGDNEVSFVVPYVVCDNSGICDVRQISLDKNNKGSIVIEDFSKNYHSITFIPSIQSKISGFNGEEDEYFFEWSVSTKERSHIVDNEEIISSLLVQIEELQAEIQRLQLILEQRDSNKKIITKDLFIGSRGSEVFALQEFLKNQGYEIYPEGLITGNFLYLTKRAVVRFQERYASEILHPIGLFRGTGFVGEMTRKKINIKI